MNANPGSVESEIRALEEAPASAASWVDRAELNKQELTTEEMQTLGDVADGRRGQFRFPPQIESEFQRFERKASRANRVALGLIPVLAFGSAPLWQGMLANSPAAMVPLLHLIELGLMLPLFMIITWAQWRHVESELSELALIVGFLLMAACVEFIRYKGAALDHRVEPYLTLTIPVAVVTLARLRIIRCVGVIAAYLTVVVGRHTLVPESSLERVPQEWLLEFLLLGVAFMGAIGTKLASRRQWAAKRLLEMMVYRDPLTGLSNRRALEERYEVAKQEVYQGERRRLFFVLLDMDLFKKVNDVYGHEYGDGVLAELGLVLAQFARRPLDMAVRLGGDEFALLLYDCDLQRGQQRVEELLAAIRALQIEHRDNRSKVITCSAGGVAVGPHQDLPDAYRAADRCLYQAKHAGRDCVVAENLD